MSIISAASNIPPKSNSTSVTATQPPEDTASNIDMSRYSTFATNAGAWTAGLLLLKDAEHWAHRKALCSAHDSAARCASYSAEWVTWSLRTLATYAPGVVTASASAPISAALVVTTILAHTWIDCVSHPETSAGTLAHLGEALQYCGISTPDKEHIEAWMSEHKREIDAYCPWIYTDNAIAPVNMFLSIATTLTNPIGTAAERVAIWGVGMGASLVVTHVHREIVKRLSA